MATSKSKKKIDDIEKEAKFVPITKVGGNDLDKEFNKGQIVGKVVRFVGLGVVIALLIGLLIFNSPKNTDRSAIWDEQTLIGNKEAKNHFIMYTDLICPYCDAFTMPLLEHKDEFMADYAEAQDVSFELRVTDFLYEYGEHNTEYSRQSAEAVACAQADGRFWDYYEAAITSLYDDFYSNGIGVSKTATPITTIDQDYWAKIGKDIGLGNSFTDCYYNHEKVDEVEQNTLEAYREMQRRGQGGMPFFVFNNFVQSGFDTAWGWTEVKQYLNYGLKSTES